MINGFTKKHVCLDNTNPLIKVTNVTGFGYQWIAYTNNGSGYVEYPAGSATSGNKTCDNLNGFTLEVGKYYHVSSVLLSGFPHLGTILSECTIPNLDHGIPLS